MKENQKEVLNEEQLENVTGGHISITVGCEYQCYNEKEQRYETGTEENFFVLPFSSNLMTPLDIAALQTLAKGWCESRGYTFVRLIY